MLPLSIPSPDFRFFELGPFRLHLYALCILVGMIVATVITDRRLTARGGERGVALVFVLWAGVLGIIGARLYHVLTHFSDFFGPGSDPVSVLYIWEGGIAIFGALLGGALGVFIASRATGIRFLSAADAAAPGILLAQAFGRVGNYINHELFGTPTTLPWGLEIESTNPAFPIGLPAGTLFHPTFLYEIIWNVIGVIVLLSLEKKFHLRWGRMMALYLIWYGTGRFFIEGMRLDPSFVFFGLRSNEITALLAIIIGIVVLLVQRKRRLGLETSVYLPGRSAPGKSVLSATSDPERYYHILPHGAAANVPGPVTAPEAAEKETAAVKADSLTVAKK